MSNSSIDNVNNTNSANNRFRLDITRVLVTFILGLLSGGFLWLDNKKMDRTAFDQYQSAQNVRLNRIEKQIDQALDKLDLVLVRQLAAAASEQHSTTPVDGS